VEKPDLNGLKADTTRLNTSKRTSDSNCIKYNANILFKISTLHKEHSQKSIYALTKP